MKDKTIILFSEMFEGKEFKKIYKLSKPRSPKFIEFITDDDDEWLIDIIEYKRKTGVVIKHVIILQKDLQKNLDIFKKDGFVEI